MNMTDRYYKALDLEPGASVDEIKQARKEMLKVWHPDRFNDDEDLKWKAQEKLKEINHAYDILMLPQPPPAQALRLDAGEGVKAGEGAKAGHNAPQRASRLAWMVTIFTSVACAIALSTFAAHRFSASSAITPAPPDGAAAQPAAAQPDMAAAAPAPSTGSNTVTLAAGPAANCGDNWVQIFDDNYFDISDDNHIICGPGKYTNLRNLPGAMKLDWGNEIQSLKVGPGVTVTIWTVEGFKGISKTFGPGSEVPLLKAIPGLSDNISAIEIKLQGAE
jgi:DnaJ domain